MTQSGLKTVQECESDWTSVTHNPLENFSDVQNGILYKNEELSDLT